MYYCPFADLKGPWYEKSSFFSTTLRWEAGFAQQGDVLLEPAKSMKFLHEIEINSVLFVTVFAIFVKLPSLRSYPKKKSCQEGLFLANSPSKSHNQ